MWSCHHDADGKSREGLSPSELAEVVASGTGTLWVDVDAGDPADAQLLGDIFRLHPLSVEDALNPSSRVKYEEFRDYLILIVRGVAFCDETEDPYDIETANFTFFLGKNYLVSVHHGEAAAVDSIRGILARRPELVTAGPARLMHAVVDEMIDAYFPLIDRLDAFMDDLEEKVFASFDQAAIRDIFSVKRLVLSLRRHLAPQRDVFNVLTNRPNPLIPPDVQLYFRDVYDHVLRINDSLDTYRELLSGTMDSYLSQISNRLGSVTKALSAVATLSLPFVVISGMWGMNFTRVPLAEHPHGFAIMMGVQLAIGFLFIGILRWRRLL